MSDNNLIGTEVVLMTKHGKMSSFWLPQPPEGKVWFNNTTGETNGKNIYFEAINGKWFARGSQDRYFRNRLGDMCTSVEIYDRGIIFSSNDAEQTEILYAENVFETSGVFHNYFIDESAEVSIGRSNENDIVYPNPLVSHMHAVIRKNKQRWSVEDLNSTNGVFVNGTKVLSKELKLGDVVFVLGLRIIIGVGFIAINDGNSRVSINFSKLKRDNPYQVDNSQRRSINEDDEENLFNRLPRKRKALNLETISIEAPPMPLNANSIPMLLRMGSPMIMSSASLLAGNITSMLSSVLFPVLTQKYTEKQRKEYEDRRTFKYGEYLRQKKQDILNEKNLELSILKYNYPEIDKLLGLIESNERLWERRTVNDDFLLLRVGNGSYPMLASLSAPSRAFEIDEDHLMHDMYELAETPVILENAPVMISLIEDDICGVLGTRKTVLEFVNQVIVQLSLLHSYDEVKIIFLADQRELKQLEFVKYIPHIWNDQRDFRFLATNTGGGYHVGEYLMREVEADLVKQRDLKEILRERPYYVVFALDKRIFDSMEVLKDIMQTERNCGVSVIAAFDNLPKECTKIFNLKEKGVHSITSLKQIDKEDELFKLDQFSSDRALMSMKVISNTKLKLISQAYTLPKMVTFLEMFGVGRVEHLNPLKRWKENNPVMTLATPVGVATDGSLFVLDLHEKFQGPHGLVAGMTGSGKSEFLISYILSMAINYHPDEVSFVLIDYKGGGLADAFDNPEKGIHLPHLVGTITNLDGGAIQRSLRSLHSEVLRRQQYFKRAKEITGEATMDIYKYQKLHRGGQLEEAMSHLFIISDEFAELKQQKPEFMDDLISIARIGRSLGIHLILATQKPSGVVNDQIRSNTKFRICLKVQEKADSHDMLKRPEAAELKETGRFYLQVGYNEFFALGQSAWSGADYEPMDEVLIQKDNSVEFIDSVGQDIYISKTKINKVNADKSQLNAVVEMVSSVAQQEKIMVRSLWLPALGTLISKEKVSQLFPENNCEKTEVIVGVIDNPDKQKQYLLKYDICRDSSLLIVGEQGSGKTTIIQNILLSLAKNCSPKQVNMYILDYSSRMLKLFSKLPHCGAVLFEEDENSLDNFFGVINGLVEERKKLFSSLEVDSYIDANAITPIPIILVVIDGFSGIKSSKIGDEHAYKLNEYIKNGNNYGVKYIIACNHPNDILRKIKQELGCVFTLQLKDKFEYSDAINHSVSNVPSKYPGRGLVYINEECLEYQAVSLFENIGTSDYLQSIKQEIETIVINTCSEFVAKHLPVLSPMATYEEFASQFDYGRIPIGYALRTKKAVALPLIQFSVLSVYFGNQNGKIPIFENLLFMAKRERMKVYTVTQSQDSVFDYNRSCHIAKEYLGNMDVINCNQESLVSLWKTLMNEVTARFEILQRYCQEQKINEKRSDIVKYTHKYMSRNVTPLFVIFENLVDFAAHLDSASALVFDKLFQMCHRFNIYFVGGIEPGDEEKDEEALIYGSFTSNGCVLFSGGQLDRQTICTFENNALKDGQMLDYNLCWMRYRGVVNPVLMPCGRLEGQLDGEDEDDTNIFG